MSPPHIWPFARQSARSTGGSADWPGGARRDIVCVGHSPLLRSAGVLNDLSTPAFTEAEDPFALFELWLDEARVTEINDPEAMALATVDERGLPDARMVLCK